MTRLKNRGRILAGAALLAAAALGIVTLLEGGKAAHSTGDVVEPRVAIATEPRQADPASVGDGLGSVPLVGEAARPVADPTDTSQGSGRRVTDSSALAAASADNGALRPRAIATKGNILTPDTEARLADQIAGFMREKEGWTPAQRKLGSQLIYAGAVERGAPMPGETGRYLGQLQLDESARIKVEITATVTDELLAVVAAHRGNIIGSYPQYHSIQAWVPLDQMAALAEDEGVRYILPSYLPLSNAGPTIWEGVVTHRADQARTVFGARGAGVKVGVLSDSLEHLAASQSAGELGTVHVIPGQEGSGKGEGTAMLEIIHDMAPDAELYFATGFSGISAFADNIVKLREAGCDIIVDDVTYFSEPPFQDGTVAQAVNQVTADGALFFSSAANSGNKNDGTASVWEGNFEPIADITLNVDGQSVPYRIHGFGSLDHNAVTRGGNVIILNWSDPWGASANDYDLLLLDDQNQAIFISNTVQDGTQPPLEIINGEIPAGYRLAVLAREGAEPRYLRLEIPRGGLNVSTAGSTFCHNAAESAITVAAVDVNTSFANPFEGGAKNPVETYSSDGPRHVFYHPDGTAITPGNVLSTGGRVLNKPDIAAADKGMTSVPGFQPFGGTSAAAPSAAAIAALLLSYNPDLSPRQVIETMQQSALDIEAPGWDRDSGHGLVMAFEALQGAPGPSVPAIDRFAPTEGPVGGLVVIDGSKFGEVTGVQFGGVAATFKIDSTTRISATVPAGATTGRLTVIAPAGIGTSTADFTVLQQPAITAFTPASGSAGTVVTIRGDHFNGATVVGFNNLDAVFTVVSPREIRATVPDGAASGRISVKTPAGTATSQGRFTIDTSPAIGGFVPAAGGVGTFVVITGVNFSGASEVAFAGVAAAFDVASDSQITATVPIGAASGPIRISTPQGTTTSATDFDFYLAPTVSGFVPSGGPVGTIVTITGANFRGTVSVAFEGATAFTAIADSNTRITALVPVGARTGPVQVTTPGGAAVSSASFAVTPASGNDLFSQARTISGQSGATVGENVAATKELGEPDHADNAGGKSVWFRWTAPGSGTWAFDTAGSSFDTLLAVYAGNTLESLALMAQNNDYAGANTSRAVFSAMAGVVYHIAIDGFYSGAGNPPQAASGALALNWAPTTSAPAITGFEPSSGPVGTTVTISGANLAGTTAVRFSGRTAAFSVQSDLQVVAIVPGGISSGRVQITTPGGVATSVTDFQFRVLSDNDHFAQARVLSGESGSVAGKNVNASNEAGEPAHALSPAAHSVWYVWTAPADGFWVFHTQGSSFDTVLGVYQGNAVNALTEIGSSDDGPLDLSSSLGFPVSQDMTYQIAVDGFGGAVGNHVLSWGRAASIPEIVDFTPRVGPAGTVVTLTGANLSAATSVGFNGVQSATFNVDSDGQITTTAPPGATTGPITVSTPNGTAVSPAVFTVGKLAGNDAFARAQILEGLDAYAVGNTIGATKEPGEPDHAEEPGGRSVWYRWTAPTSGTWVFDTTGSGFDTLLAVYTGVDLATLVPIAENDDWSEDFSSRVVLDALAGTEYRIAVDGYDGESGRVILRYFRQGAGSVLYATAFEAAEGYGTGFTLAGQQGWQSDGSGGNGIVNEYIPGRGQQAYIGYNPPDFGEDALIVWHDLDHDPAQQPVVEFAVTMMIVDSLNLAYDTFYWSAFNSEWDELFFISFNNETLEILYGLDDDAGAMPTGRYFENAVPQELSVIMDFAANRWSASFDGETIIPDQPITTTGAALDLADFDAGWAVHNSFWPGDNYMLFDNYRIATGGDPEPVLVAGPRDQTVEAGTEAVFAVIADGATPLSYQWLKDGQPISGATEPSLVLRNVQSAEAGAYSVQISNPAGSIASQSATLAVQQPTPLITMHPVPRVVLLRSEVRFSVVASGTPPLRYQWQKDGVNVPAATGVSLLLSDVPESVAGEYRVVVSNPGGSIISRAASLVVEHPTTFLDWVRVYLADYPVADQAPGADPDHDGQPNAVEYGLGSAPDDATSRAVLSGSLLEQGEATYLAISFTPNERATDVTLSGEFSPTLHPANWQSDGVKELPAGPGVVLGQPVDTLAPSGFLRIRVEVQP